VAALRSRAKLPAALYFKGLKDAAIRLAGLVNLHEDGMVQPCLGLGLHRFSKGRHARLGIAAVVVLTSGGYSDAMDDVTVILSAIDRGDMSSAAKLLPLVYDELRRLASEKIAFEKPGHTLDATALVHEAFIRLTGSERLQAMPLQFNGSRHFFAVAAEAMRRILVENARRKKAEKRGGGRQRVDLDEANTPGSASEDELILLDSALSQLARENAEAAEIAKLRLFGGMTIDDAGTLTGVSRATAFRSWTYARAWLNAHLQGAEKT
jgi:RNA polymerase sigma factor (TIGR02999 family)